MVLGVLATSRPVTVLTVLMASRLARAPMASRLVTALTRDLSVRPGGRCLVRRHGPDDPLRRRCRLASRRWTGRTSAPSWPCPQLAEDPKSRSAHRGFRLARLRRTPESRRDDRA